jgi:hypothetical protein
MYVNTVAAWFGLRRLAPVRVLLLTVALLWPVAADAQQQTTITDAGLGVDGVIANYTVQPGQVLEHTMNVRLGKDAPQPLDVQVDARGLGQGLDGAAIALEPAEDTSPFSARTFVTNIDHTRLHLEPGSAQSVKATIAVPDDVNSGMRYADIYFHSEPTGSGRVGVVLATHVTVILSLAGSEFTQTGSINKLDVAPVESGKPIQVTTVVQNTGNQHYRANALVGITDARGKQIAQVLVPQSGSSILPGFPRAYVAAFPLLDNLDGLPVGAYSVDSKIVLDDGRLLDDRKTSFQVTEPYDPFPDLDPSTRVVVKYNDEEPKPIDAREQADLRVVFSDTGKVTGTVVLGRFKTSPSGAPRISDATVDGGLNKPGLKYWGLAVQGFSKGMAEVTGFYADPELNGILPNSLLLAHRVSAASGWVKLDNLSVFPNAQNARGDVPVQVLTASVPIALSGDPVAPTLLDALSNYPVIVGAIALLMVGLLGGAFAIGRRRRSAR